MRPPFLQRLWRSGSDYASLSAGSSRAIPSGSTTYLLTYRMKPGKGNDAAAGEAYFPGQGRIEIIAFRPRFSSERMRYT